MTDTGRNRSDVSLKGDPSQKEILQGCAQLVRIRKVIIAIMRQVDESLVNSVVSVFWF